jgi:hypothetical protein
MQKDTKYRLDLNPSRVNIFPSPHSLPIRLGGEETMRFGGIIYTIFGV